MEKIEVYKIEADNVSDELSALLGVDIENMYHDNQSFGTSCYDLVHADKETTEHDLKSFEELEEEYGEFGGDSSYLDRDLRYLVHKGVYPKGKYLVEIDY